MAPPPPPKRIIREDIPLMRGQNGYRGENDLYTPYVPTDRQRQPTQLEEMEKLGVTVQEYHQFILGHNITIEKAVKAEPVFDHSTYSQYQESIFRPTKYICSCGMEWYE